MQGVRLKTEFLWDQAFACITILFILKILFILSMDFVCVFFSFVRRVSRFHLK